MKVYNYDYTTGEYIGPGLADESPLEPGVWLIPGGATDVAPHEPIPGHTVVWNGTKWIDVIDYRGQNLFCTKTGRVGEVTTIGDIPPDVTLEIPKSDFDVWNGAAWKKDYALEITYRKGVAMARIGNEQIAAMDEMRAIDYAIELQVVTDAELERLKVLKLHYVLLSRVRFQSGFPMKIEWPVLPEAV